MSPQLCHPNNMQSDPFVTNITLYRLYTAELYKRASSHLLVFSIFLHIDIKKAQRVVVVLVLVLVVVVVVAAAAAGVVVVVVVVCTSSQIASLSRILSIWLWSRVANRFQRCVSILSPSHHYSVVSGPWSKCRRWPQQWPLPTVRRTNCPSCFPIAVVSEKGNGIDIMNRILVYLGQLWDWKWWFLEKLQRQKTRCRPGSQMCTFEENAMQASESPGEKGKSELCRSMFTQPKSTDF